jgi:ribosomal protein S18 acetylase RimI-like enzyme
MIGRDLMNCGAPVIYRHLLLLATDQADTASFQRSRKFVACVGEQVVGFVGIDRTYLLWLYVDQACYGQGIGRRLLRLGLQLIGSQAWTIVLAGNIRTQRLYESEGFRVVRIYESTKAGYLCACVQLALSLAKVADSVEEGSE